MKTTIRLLGILLMLATLVSCESIKSLADVEFDTMVDTDLDIAVADQAKKSGLADYTYDTSAVLDPTSDPEVQKYVNNIKNYQVTSITAKVTKVSAEGIKLLANTYFRLSDDSDNVKWVLTEDFDAVVGNTYTLGNDNGEWNTVNTILGRNGEFTLSSAGSSNMNNITIKLKLSIGAKITANPL